ncbi:MAG: hypothetical protein ACXVAX_09260 [Pseudobdellovibrio sp.]
MESIKRNWKEIKLGLQHEWAKISDEDWKQTKGHEDAVVELLQHYGFDKDIVEPKVNEIYAKHTTFENADAAEDISKSTFSNKPYISGSFSLSR